MQYALCRHIKTNGTQCEAPSLSDGQWCFFHSRLHQRHSRFRPIEVASDSIVRAQPVHLSALEDRESVQVALSVVINALASGQMEPRHATALLYGLQIASNNASGLHTEPSANTIVRSIEPSTEGLDLAQPGALETDDLYHFNEDDDEEEEEEEEEEDDNEDRDISEESIEEQI